MHFIDLGAENGGVKILRHNLIDTGKLSIQA